VTGSKRPVTSVRVAKDNKKMKKIKRKIKPDHKATKQRNKAVEAALVALDAVYRESHQRYASFVETIQGLPPLEKAEAWLTYVSSHMEDFGEQEALVYLASRRIDCARQIAAMIARWRDGERHEIAKCAEGHLEYSLNRRKPKRIMTRSLAEASQIEKLSPYELRDFWFGVRQQELTIEATMLRTVNWCGVGGFEPWWRRLAKETARLFSYGGMDRPALSFWIFSMCRSDYAVTLMHATLKRARDNLKLLDYGQPSPWTFDFAVRKPAAEHIPAAASLVFSNLILQPNKINDALVLAAISTLQKQQNEDGSWPFWAAENEEPSIEATAMAMHAIALSRPSGHERMLSLGREYLLGHQNRSGHWDDRGSSDVVYLTVLVLDAIELANGGTSLTFGLPGSSVKTSSESRPKMAALQNTRRFRVALTFPGEIRPFVNAVADRLSELIGRGKVFYDKYYEAELARPNLDTYLQSAYHDESDLVVVFSCSDYDKKEWCGLEWRAVRDIIKQRRGQDVMIIRMDDTKLEGLYSIDGYIDAQKRRPNEIADLIFVRMSSYR